MKCSFPEWVVMKEQETSCLFSSNYPHARRPFAFSLFLTVFPAVRCCVAAFPFIFSQDSRFLTSLSASVFRQPVLLCEDASSDASRPSAPTTITSDSHAFYLGFLNPDHSANPFCGRAHTQRSCHVQGGGKMACGWKSAPGEGAATKRPCFSEKNIH